MRVRPAVAQMPAYNPPLEGRSDKDYLLLDFSESTIPPSPQVLEALHAYLRGGRLQMYPSYGTLRDKVARYAGTRPEQVLLTNGSDSAIQLILQALLEPGDEMVLARPHFFILGATALSLGARVVSPQYHADMSYPYEEVLAAITERTRVVVIINPNNPTGTSVGLQQVEELLRRHPRVAVFVDEAYYEFSHNTVVPLLERYDNLVISRTFSKAQAIAGLRFGYALSNAEFIAQLHKLRIPYDVNSMAVVAAEASLDHPEPWQAYVREVMEQSKPLVERFLTEHGVPFFHSDCNFILVQAGDPQAATEFLKEHDILVRPQRPPVEQCFRVSLGTVEQMRSFLRAFSSYLDRIQWVPQAHQAMGHARG